MKRILLIGSLLLLLIGCGGGGGGDDVPDKAPIQVQTQGVWNNTTWDNMNWG